MEIRKLQKAGGSSLTITLPKKWLDDVKLKDKDLIKMYPDGLYSLVLQPTNIKKQLLKTVIKADSLSNSVLAREIIAAYITGTDEIVVKTSEIQQQQRTRIRTICNSLIGFELVDESSGEMILKNVFDPTKFPMSQNIEKMFHITKAMVSDAFKALTKKDVLLAKDIIDRDIEIDKLYLAIARQLYIVINNKVTQEELGFDQLALHYYENVAAQLERIADHAVKISKIVSIANNELALVEDTVITDVENKIIMLLNDSITMVTKLDKNIAHKILESNEELENIIFPNKVLNHEETYLWNLINDSFDRFRGYIMNIAEFTLDQATALAKQPKFE